MRRERATEFRWYVVVLSGVLFLSSSPWPNPAQAQDAVDKARVPLSFLQRVSLRSARPSDDLLKAGRGIKVSSTRGLSALAVRSPSGIDSVPTWSDHFTAAGFDDGGNPQSVWPYTMVGTPPESGCKTSIGAPVLPVTVDLLGPDGRVASWGGVPLSFAATPDIVKATLDSPIFQPFTYTSGTGQFNDQMMRAEFANRTSGDGWHVTLTPKVKCDRRIRIPFGSWHFYATDRPVAALVDANAFVAAMFPQTLPVDDQTLMGAAELAGDITTRDISTFLFNNVFLYEGSLENCCILGFHSYDSEPGDAKNGSRERRYLMNYASWISNGLLSLGFGDVTGLSHEMSETYHDPFDDNLTPWWLTTDPLLGGQLCQNSLETGDVVEVLSSNPVFAISMHGRTYHMQNEALFSWFAGQSLSLANLGAYSFPDETTLMALSPGPLLPGCVPAL